MKRLAFTIEGIAVMLVLGAYMLPESAPYWASFLCLGLLWLPLNTFTSKKIAATLMLVLLGVTISAYILSPDVTARLKEVGPSFKVAVSLAMAWTLCVFCLDEGGPVSLPLGLLSCVGAIAIPSPSATSRDLDATLTAIAAVLLIVSAAMYFHGSLLHPQTRASRLFRTSLLQITLPLFLGLFSVGIMVLTADFFREQFSKLSIYLPVTTNDSPACELNTRAPKFRGIAVCSVTSLSGPLPGYLGEYHYTEYEDGRWLQPVTVFSNLMKNQNLSIEHSSDTQVRRCSIDYHPQHELGFAPFGSIRYTTPRKANSEKDPKPKTADTTANRTAFFNWLPQPVPVSIRTASDEATMPENLERLKIRARELCAGIHDDLAKTRRINRYLSTNYVYDRASSFKSGKTTDPAENFLFEEKRGWCIHFASATALMLRAVGVETKFATGYRISEKTQHAVVLDRHAHAWCEALVQTPEGQGWYIVDPSPAPASLPPQEQDFDLRYITVTLLASAVLIVLVCKLAVKIRRRRQARALSQNTDDNPANFVMEGYSRALEKLAREGIYRPAHLTPREFACHKVPADLQPDMLIVTQAFEQAKYMHYSDAKIATDEFREALLRLLR